MKKYIWQSSEYPHFTYDKELILSMLADVKMKQGYLSGKMSGIGFNKHHFLGVLTEDVIKSNEIEGCKLSVEQVRSSIAKRLGLNWDSNIYIERNVDGIVEMMFDAVKNYDKPLTKNRLFGWQAAMFPGGYNGMYKISIGRYRNDKNGVMQVVSGAIGHEKIHYEAPPADTLEHEMSALLNYINNKDGEDWVIKAGVAHLWFVIVHPFEDGNGRIARAITDMLLARSEKTSKRYYSMSSQIKKVRKSYYEALMITQKNSTDITEWLKWFLETLNSAIDNSNDLLKSVFAKANFWKNNQNMVFNERQIKILNKLLENFEGNLTSSKWAKICNCSHDTATRDITDLIQKNILIKKGDGRSTHYVINFVQIIT